MSLTTKTFTSKTRSFTYEYLFAKPSGDLPTLLFLHGFPESKYCWRYQTAYFGKKGFGIIAPDLLGYGGTSKPASYKDYAFGDMVVDLAEILDHEAIAKVVVVGHDWGALPCARFTNFYPERVLATIFLAAGYFPPKGHWDIHEYNKATKAGFGYETMGYFLYQGELPAVGELSASAKLTQSNIESFMALLFPEDPLVWKTDFCPLGRMKEWLEQGKTGPLNKHLTKEEVEEYKALISRDIETNLNWYRAAVHDVHFDVEQALPDGSEILTAPVLFLASKNDYACIPALYTATMPAFCPDLTVKEFETSHWMMWEEPEAINKAIDEFLKVKVLAA